MLTLLFTLFTSTLAFASSPTCKGIVATPAQRDAYTTSMLQSWDRAWQNQYLINHENHLKTEEGRHQWSLLYNEERMAIIKYTESFYGQMNQELREGDFSMWIPFIPLCSGLNKLPNYRGWVYRILNLTAERFHEIKSKGTYFDPGFMSTSLIQTLLWKGNAQLKIFTRNGKNLEGLSAHSREKEILLLPGSRFKVHRIKENAPSSKYKYEIELKEIEPLESL